MQITILLASLLVISAWGSECGTDEKNLNSYAKSDSQGKSPDGNCYSHVADYIDAVGYGGINKGHFNDCIPPAYWNYAYQFAEYLNKGSNAADLCLKNAQSSYSNNPYKAPTGAIVVVRAGTPGTANPVAGDIAVDDEIYKGLHEFVRSINPLTVENDLKHVVPRISTHQDFCLLNLF